MASNVSRSAIALQIGVGLFIAMVWRLGWPSEYSDTRTVVLICAAGGPLMTYLTFDGQPWRSWFERGLAYAGVFSIWALVLLGFVAPQFFRGDV